MERVRRRPVVPIRHVLEVSCSIDVKEIGCVDDVISVSRPDVAKRRRFRSSHGFCH